MAATIQTIQKPTRARALDTSGNNNHGQIYSGRALEFDGVTDYLDLGGAVTLVDFSEETTQANRAWTVACWIYLENAIATAPGQHIIGGGTNSSSMYCAVYTTEKLAIWDIDADGVGGSSNGSWRQANTALELKTWYRALWVFDGDETVTFYVNGVADGTGRIDSQGDNADLMFRYIGGTSFYPTRRWDGKLSDLQLWQGAFTADDALYDYNNPEQLVLNRSGTSLTNSNLKAWYPMNDGHRGQQSYILDASNTGLGANVVQNGTFDTDTSGWLSDSGCNLTWQSDGTVFVETTNDQTFAIKQNSILKVGTTYKVTYRIKPNNTGRHQIRDGGNVLYYTDSLIANEWNNIEAYINPLNPNIHIQAAGGAGIDNFYLDDVIALPINDKNHAPTYFYSHDLWDGADGNVTNWVSRDSSTHVSVGGMIKSTAGVSNQGSRIFLKNDADLSTDLTVGRTYRCTLLAGTDTTSGSSIGIYDGANTIWPSGGGSSVIASNILDNGTFDSNMTGWTEVDTGAGSINRTTTGPAGHNGTHSVRLITASGDTVNISQTEAGLTAGDTYLFTYWSYGDGSVGLRHQVYDNSNSANIIATANDNSGNTAAAWAKTEVQFTLPADCTSVRIRFYSPHSNGTAYVDDVMVSKMVKRTIDFTAANTTGAFISHTDARGNNEILSSSSANSDFEDAGQTAPTTVSYFPAGGASSGATIDADNTSSPLTGSKDLKFTNSSGASAAVVFTEGIPMTAGKIYHVEFNYKVGSGDTLKYKIGTTAAHDAANINTAGGYAAVDNLTATSKTAFSQRFTHTDTDAECFLILRCDDGENFQVDDIAVRECETAYFDDITLKETGTASGWTDADQQLDIPQTALQSYNQLAWFPGEDPGTDYEVEIGQDSVINDIWAGGGAVSAWIYPVDDGAGGAARIIDKDKWLLYMASGTTKLAYTFDHATADASGVTTNAVLAAGKWAHVVMSYDSDNPATQPKIYVNGEQVAVTENSPEGEGSYQSDAGNDLFIGNKENGTRTFHGSITEVSLWGSGLSADNVKELYNDGKALSAIEHSTYVSSPGTLKGYWRNNGLTTWSDLSDNSNNAVPANLTETMLITAGADGSRDSQGFLMNRERTTNSLNLRGSLSTEHGEGDYMNTNNKMSFAEDGFTLSFWVKYTDLSGRGIAGMNDGSNHRMYIGQASLGADNMLFGCGDGYVSGTNNQITEGKWHHVLTTYDGGSVLKCYFDGVYDKTKTDITFSGVSTDNFWIGSFESEQYVVRGFIDDVLIYTDVKTDGGVSLTETAKGEIARIYNAGKRSHK